MINEFIRLLKWAIFRVADGALACLIMTPLVVNAQVHIVAPDWSNFKAPYVEEAVQIQLGIDGFGSAVFANAAAPLPDNVVNAIEQSSFKEKPFVGKSAELTVVVRRPLTDGRERLLMPDWEIVDYLLHLNEARMYLAKEAERLERKAEHTKDREILATLLAYYTWSPLPDVATAKRRRGELIEWFIDNDPDGDLLGSQLALINTKDDRLSDPAMFAEIASRWKAAVAAHPKDSHILDHAVRFLAVPDSNAALYIVNGAAAWGARMRWAGRIYALRAIGATSIDLDTGNIKVDPSAANTNSRHALLIATSTPEVLSAMWTLRGNESGDTAFCRELYEHAKTLFPATQATCPSNTSERKTYVEPELVKRVNPNYPTVAKSAGIQGTVEFRALINKTGDIVDLEFLKGPLALYQASRESVLQWHYKPRLMNNEPIDFTTEITVNYSLGR
jgi:hypothetical protein